MFREDDVVIDIGDRAVTVDKDGYELWKKYSWRYNLTVRHLYRNECIGVDKKGRYIYRIVLFWIELLGYPKVKRVYFENRDRLDLRRTNLINC